MESGKQEQEEEISKLLLDMMKGYSDSVIPPLSQISPLHEPAAIGEKGSSSRKRGGRPPVHATKSGSGIQKEKERREKMSDSFALLKSMVPNLCCTKATRDKIVHETTKYILSLEKEKERLEKLKETSSEPMVSSGRMLLPSFTNSNPSFSVEVDSKNVAFFGIESLVRQGLVTQIFMVFQKHQVEVLAANVAVDHGQLTVTVTASVNGKGGKKIIEKIKKDILHL